ncbi:prefoldin subunit 3 [Diaporthe eres]|nr:prefoldin subunit 3 [Diaporthe eres]
MADKGKAAALGPLTRRAFGRRSKDTPTNPRGIPYAPFVDRVEDYVTSRADTEPTLRKFQEMIAKYQYMESNMQRKAAGLQDKIPDIQKTLDTVQFLKTRTDEADPIETTFELNDTLFAKAEVPPTDEVYIWLGANVMLAYPMDEAETLLVERLDKAKKSLVDCEEDAEFLREQITTMEVATARVYNWDVVQKRKEKGEEESKEKDDKAGGG